MGCFLFVLYITLILSERQTTEMGRLQVGVWNIRGLATSREHNLDDLTVLHFIYRNEISTVTESHSDKDSDLDVRGYRTISKHGMVIHGRTNRHYGGVVAYVKEDIWEDVNEITTDFENMICLRVEGSRLASGKPLCICIIYVHLNKGKKEGPLDELSRAILMVQGDDDFLIMGDLNARVGRGDFNNWSVDSRGIEDLGLDTIDDSRNMLGKTQDRGRNMYGNELIQLCNDANMEMLNGMTNGDKVGRYTCYSSPSNPSVIDLALVNEDLKERISFFRVRSLLADLSDHYQITTTVRATHKQTKCLQKMDKSLEPVVKLKCNWTLQSKQEVMNTLRTESCKILLNKAVTDLENNNTAEKMDATIDIINNTLQEHMTNSCCCSPKNYDAKNANSHRIKINKPWFTKRCKELKRLKREHGKGTTNSNKKAENLFRAASHQYKKAK